MTHIVTLDRERLTAMLEGAVCQVKAHREMLSELDSHGGDGDHGTTMVRAMANLEKTLEESSASDLKILLYEIGWAIMGVDGGATGPLFGAFFMGMSETLGDGDAVDAEGLSASFEAGLTKVQQQTRAHVGDKTLIDALVPAVAGARQAAGEGVDIVAVLERAAEAAEHGAAATAALQALFGRAKNIGAQSIGAQDPGATSVALLFRGFAEGIEAAP